MDEDEICEIQELVGRAASLSGMPKGQFDEELGRVLSTSTATAKRFRLRKRSTPLSDKQKKDLVDFIAALIPSTKTLKALFDDCESLALLISSFGFASDDSDHIAHLIAEELSIKPTALEAAAQMLAGTYAGLRLEYTHKSGEPLIVVTQISVRRYKGAPWFASGQVRRGQGKRMHLVTGYFIPNGEAYSIIGKDQETKSLWTGAVRTVKSGVSQALVGGITGFSDIKKTPVTCKVCFVPVSDSMLETLPPKRQWTGVYRPSEFKGLFEGNIGFDDAEKFLLSDPCSSVVYPFNDWLEIVEFPA